MNKIPNRNTEEYKKKHREYCKSHYQNNKRYYYQRNVETKKEQRQWVIEYKESKGCADCKQKFPYYVLDFDHRDSNEKAFEIGTFLRRSVGWRKLLAEIDKCDVVCSNCHRIRTFSRTIRTNGIVAERLCS